MTDSMLASASAPRHRPPTVPSTLSSGRVGALGAGRSMVLRFAGRLTPTLPGLFSFQAAQPQLALLPSQAGQRTSALRNTTARQPTAMALRRASATATRMIQSTVGTACPTLSTAPCSVPTAQTTGACAPAFDARAGTNTTRRTVAPTTTRRCLWLLDSPHQRCVQPAVRSIPQDAWVCPLCKLARSARCT